MTRPPTAATVAAAWITAIPGVPRGGVGTELPDNPATWPLDGFVQVTAVAGAPGIHVPLRRPIVQVDCWAVGADQRHPPWAVTETLAEVILAATYTIGHHKIVAAAGLRPARLMSVYPLTEPQRVPGSDAVFARVRTDLQLAWVVT